MRHRRPPSEADRLPHSFNPVRFRGVTRLRAPRDRVLSRATPTPETAEMHLRRVENQTVPGWVVSAKKSEGYSPAASVVCPLSFQSGCVRPTYSNSTTVTRFAASYSPLISRQTSSNSSTV